jgi:hypothetical protein
MSDTVNDTVKVQNDTVNDAVFNVKKSIIFFTQT